MDQLMIDLPETDASTLGGLVIEQIGRIPDVDENLTLGPHEITILKAEPTRIQSILLTRGISEEQETD